VGVIGIICGIIGVCLGWLIPLIGIICGFIAIVTGGIAMTNNDRNGPPAIILGILSLVLAFVFMILWFAIITSLV
jgi:hypothetical protein